MDHLWVVQHGNAPPTSTYGRAAEIRYIMGRRAIGIRCAALAASSLGSWRSSERQPPGCGYLRPQGTEFFDPTLICPYCFTRFDALQYLPQGP
eukprot:6472357-Amphidinium_carterae.1